MVTTLQLLDRLKSKLGSDYQTHKALGITTQRVSQLRTVGGVFTDEQGLKAAEILDLKAEFVLLSLAAERSEKRPIFATLKKIADQFEPKAAAAAVIFSIFLAASLAAPVLPSLA